MIDAVELAGEVLPRKWVRRVVLLLLGSMALTGNYALASWFVREESAKIKEDIVTPMMESILREVAPTKPPVATP